MDLLLNPPNNKNSHSETYEKFTKESEAIILSLSEKSAIMTTQLNKMKYFQCNEIEGIYINNYI